MLGKNGRCQARTNLFPVTLLLSLILLVNYTAELRARTFPTSEQKAQSQATTLDLGRPVVREIASGQTHSYQITTSTGQFTGVTVQQRGIDVVERLFAPDGKLLAEFDDDARPQAPEQADFVSAVGGTYRLDIEANFKGLTGKYEIRLTELRAATDKERLLFESRKLETQAEELFQAARFDDALPLVTRALELAEQQLGSENPYVGRLLNRLAALRFDKGDYAPARALYERSLAIDEKVLGHEHPDTVSAIERLGTIHSHLNEYAEAQALLEEALQLTEKTLGPDHPTVIACLRDLASLNQYRGDNERAETELQRAIAIAEKSVAPDDYLLIQVLNNLGVLYNSEKKYDRAEPLLQRALELAEKRFGPNGYQTALQLQNLALIAQERTKDYARALELYWRAEKILEQTSGSEHRLTLGILNNIANIYRSTGDYSKSLELHLRVHGILEKRLGPYNGQTLVSLGNITRTYWVMGDVPNAIKFQALTDDAIEKNLVLNLAIGSERQKLAFFDSLADRTNRTVSLNVYLAPHNQEACDLAALVILQRKGRVLDAMSNSLAALRGRLNPDDQKLLDELNTTTARAATIMLNGPGKTAAPEYQRQIAMLSEQKEKLEAEVSRRSAEFKSQTQSVTLEAVQGAIPHDAALIEFVAYKPFDPKADVTQAYGQPRYVAYVIRNGVPVRWVELGPAKEIDARIDAFRKALRDPDRKDTRQLARAVDEKLMQPVRELVGGATRLLISADAELNLIPFAALVDEKDRYLVQRYSITYLTSGRDLLRLQLPRQSKSGPVIIADPVFGDPAPVTNRSEPMRGDGVRIDYSRPFFGPLPGVNNEVRGLRELLPDATFLLGEQATKAALQSLVAPKILHVATHGFFRSETRPQTSSPVDAKASNPLLRSGLALAGANHGDSGILTALEASGLNLWGTKLVVLSACDTGLGEIRNGEGVYGLRRALVLAGTESQMMSLWPVSDRSTRELMISFYTNLVRGEGRGDALRQAQLQMLQNNARNHPYYWASFIQAGEWANLEGKR